MLNSHSGEKEELHMCSSGRCAESCTYSSETPSWTAGQNNSYESDKDFFDSVSGSAQNY